MSLCHSASDRWVSRHFAKSPGLPGGAAVSKAPEPPDTGALERDPSASGPRLSTSFTQEGESVRVGARGEVDVSTRDALSAAGLHALKLPSVREVVIDLDLVTFIDAAGLGSLVTIRNASGVNGKSLVLANVPTRIIRVLRLSDLLRHFTIAVLTNDDDVDRTTFTEGRA